VDILAEQARFDAAHELEMLGETARRAGIVHAAVRLRVGVFGDARDAEALHRICRAHTAIQADAGYLVGTWLLNDRQSRYHTH
jgi:hypothetical protein